MHQPRFLRKLSPAILFHYPASREYLFKNSQISSRYADVLESLVVNSAVGTASVHSAVQDANAKSFTRANIQYLVALAKSQGVEPPAAVAEVEEPVGESGGESDGEGDGEEEVAEGERDGTDERDEDERTDRGDDSEGTEY